MEKVLMKDALLIIFFYEFFGEPSQKKESEKGGERWGEMGRVRRGREFLNFPPLSSDFFESFERGPKSWKS